MKRLLTITILFFALTLSAKPRVTGGVSWDIFLRSTGRIRAPIIREGTVTESTIRVKECVMSGIPMCCWMVAWIF